MTFEVVSRTQEQGCALETNSDYQSNAQPREQQFSTYTFFHHSQPVKLHLQPFRVKKIVSAFLLENTV